MCRYRRGAAEILAGVSVTLGVIIALRVPVRVLVLTTSTCTTTSTRISTATATTTGTLVEPAHYLLNVSLTPRAL